MFYKTCLFICVFMWEFVQGNKPITISLQPEEIMESFKSIVSSDYIKLLANEFATKAAEHFISEIKTKEKDLEDEYKNNLRWTSLHGNTRDRNPLLVKAEDKVQLQANDREKWSKIDVEKSPNIDFKVPEVQSTNSAKPVILNEEQAMTLLNDPSPDGDNLEEQLTDAEGDADKAVPVIGVMKINGMYYRRLLGVI